MKKSYINDYKFNSIFIRIFATLILLSILPGLIVSIIIYKNSTSAIQEQARYINMDMLDKTDRTVDLILKGMDQTIRQVAHNDSVINLAISPNFDYYSRNNTIISSLKNIKTTNEYIESIYVYSVYGDIVLTSNGTGYTLASFYDKAWVEVYNNTAFEDTYCIDHRKMVNESGNKINVITVMANLPYSSGSKIGAVVININEDKIYNSIKNEENNSEIYIINSSGEIISHKDKNRLYNNINYLSYINPILTNDRGSFVDKIDGKEMFFSYITSPYNGWKYIYVLPMAGLQKNVDMISRITIITTILFAILCLIMSFLFSKEIYNPIEKLVNLVMASSKYRFSRDNVKVKNEYEFLGYAYSDVIDSNKNMANLLNNAKPVIKEKLFTSLILGVNTNMEEISEKLSFLNIDFTPENFVVSVVQIDGYKEFCEKYNEAEKNIYKIKLINVIEKIISNHYKGVCIEVESDKIAAIINLNDNIAIMNAQAELLVIAETIKSRANKEFPFTITLGIGRMYKDIANISLSYNEALNALKYKLYQGKNEIINIDDIKVQSEELYYYDSEKEKMIINNLKIGQQKEVEILIEELTQEILKHKNIPYNYVQQVFIGLISSVIELIINMGMTIDGVFGAGYNLYEELSTKETIKDIQIWMVDICKLVIQSINNINQVRSNKNVERILQYIDENLDQDIPLNTIADMVGLSSAYVSRIFKEHIGTNYVEYLSKKRVEKAKQLLKNTKLTVEEIGFKVGFNNIRTFMRTFKKCEGVPPGQYRDNI